MNLPNRITLSRLILSVVIIILLLFPFESAGFNFPNIFVNELIVVNVKYLIAGVLFIIASFTDFLDGRIARKKHLVTDFGKLMDAIADKVLVNSVLIILASQGFIHPIIPVIIIVRDTAINSIRMIASTKGNVIAAGKTGKFKTLLLMIGIVLTLFYNLPFELFNLKVADIFLIVATVLAVVSGVQYYNANKKLLIEK